MMVVIGLVCSKKNEDVSDFYLGGRKLGPIVTAMSAEASDMSSWLLMGLPGVAYLTGCAEAGWTAIYYPLFQFIHFDASRHSKLKASKVSREEAKVI